MTLYIHHSFVHDRPFVVKNNIVYCRFVAVSVKFLIIGADRVFYQLEITVSACVKVRCDYVRDRIFYIVVQLLELLFDDVLVLV